MRVLVAGASGFLGSNILEVLRQEKQIRIETIGRRTTHLHRIEPRIVHHILDLEKENILDFFLKNKYDVLIHAAWRGLPNRDPVLNLSNLEFSSQLYEKFKYSGGKAIIAFGSCLEYGQAIGSLSEEELGINLDDFGKTKRLLGSKLSMLGIPYLWIRPFYLYGKNQHSNSLLHETLRFAESEKPLWISNPNSTHDFVHVADLARVVLELLKKELWIGEVNIGTGNSVSILEFVNEIRKILGRPRYETQEIERAGMYADLGKLLHFLPNFKFTSLSEGMKSTLQSLESSR